MPSTTRFRSRLGGRCPQAIGLTLVALVLASGAPGLSAPTNSLRTDAWEALHRGIEFFRKEVAVEGTYLWRYSADLSQREGEGVASKTQGWVQPPGTPSVGMAFLEAWRATGETNYLHAARETADGLIRGQLRSGGWTYSIDFSREGRRKFAYREGGATRGRNVSTLDDDTTQSVLRFLSHVDRELRFGDARIHGAVLFGMNALLDAQYPNGAWPQGFSGPAASNGIAVVKATCPESWSRIWPGSGEYWFRYTLNDDSQVTTMRMLLEVGRVHRSPEAGPDSRALATRCRAAVIRAGEFLLLAQMPEPQPGWAQQYDFAMHPAWARKFEPPAISGAESGGVLRMLITLYQETGEHRFLDPVPRALEYFRRSRLPDGRLARFYELKSNRPLYFTRGYVLTHDDGDMPTHYSFKTGDWTTSVAREFAAAQKEGPATNSPALTGTKVESTQVLESEVRRVIAAQDTRGRWLEPGGLRYHRPKDPSVQIIDTGTFVRNIGLLSRYLEGTRPTGE